MASCMFGDSFRYVKQTKSPITHSPAEIHIFKPEREEFFIEAAKFLPDLAPHHQERTRGLLNHAAYGVIQIQTAVAPVYRVVPVESV